MPHCHHRLMVQSHLRYSANVPLHEGTLAPPGKYDWTCASFGPPESTTQMANRLVQLFLHRSWQKAPILYNGRPFPPKKMPIPCGHLDPYLIPYSLGTSEPISQTASWLVELFLHRWPHSVPILYNGTPLSPSPQNCPIPWGDLDSHPIYGSLGPPESSTQTASWLVQPFLQDSLVWQTDQQTTILGW